MIFSFLFQLFIFIVEFANMFIIFDVSEWCCGFGASSNLSYFLHLRLRCRPLPSPSSLFLLLPPSCRPLPNVCMHSLGSFCMFYIINLLFLVLRIMLFMCSCLCFFSFSTPFFLQRWQRRWFVLYDDGELTYSVDEHVSIRPQQHTQTQRRRASERWSLVF